MEEKRDDKEKNRGRIGEKREDKEDNRGRMEEKREDKEEKKAILDINSKQEIEGKEEKIKILDINSKEEIEGKEEWKEETEYVILVNYYDGDIEWTKRLKMPYIIYYKNRQDKQPYSAINKGKSESNLCKFIYEFYDNLPKNIINVHQYEYKWHHDGSIVDILNDEKLKKNYKESKTEGFYSFNNFYLGNIRPQLKKIRASKWWLETMEKWFGSIEEYGNFTKNKKGAAQFIVSRERIKSLPRDFWYNMYFWLVTKTDNEVTTGFDPITKSRILLPSDMSPFSNANTSRYLEWTWELIFTSFKSWEKTDMFCAWYGYGRYFYNVTNHIKQFISNNTLVIPTNQIFNDIFGDPCFGSLKTFFISINGVTYSFPENRIDPIILNLPLNFP